MTDRHLGLTPLGQTEAHGVQLVSLLGPEMCCWTGRHVPWGKVFTKTLGKPGLVSYRGSLKHGHVPNGETVLKPLR